jgi:predicted lipoprotein with Yx(FWY)xxD motif
MAKSGCIGVRLRRTVALGCVLLAASLSAAADQGLPPGIGIELTLEGPVFVDAKGMTLYIGEGRACNDSHRIELQPTDNAGSNRDVAFALELPLSCAQKNPPLLASANAQPFGMWTLIERDDGAKQWAYDGHPLHTSIKDQQRGDINGSYRVRIGSSEPNARPVAQAPMPDLPAGLTVRETVAGLVFASHTGKTLYYQDPGSKRSECTGSCAQKWQPFYAPALASTTGVGKQWSIVTGAGGGKQWAYDGHPLYTYAYDAPAHGGQLFGHTFGSIWGPSIEGWRIAIAKAAPRYPAEVSLHVLPATWEQFNTPLPKVIYADSRGLTLYTMHCRPGRAGLSCDDIGDDPRYWLDYCGGETRCAKTWRPLPAPANAQSIDHLWSVITIDPKHPFRPIATGEGMRVWAFRGRPVFTYVRDALPGDFQGDDQAFAISGDGFQARPIPAYGRQTEARAPQLMLSTISP